jgi:SAM-dependent methyltransferase
VTDSTVNFDSVAHAYRWLEYATFGPCLSRCRKAQITQITNARHALIFGDGDGRFLQRLLAVNHKVTVDVVDSSEIMLKLLERRISRCDAEVLGRVRLHHADALMWNPMGSYDLIVSHFFLDCFFPAQLEQLFDRLLPHAAPGARWIVSEFAIPRSRMAAPFARSLVFALYVAFGWLTRLRVRSLPDYANIFGRRGIILTRERRYLSGLLCSQVWEMARSPRSEHRNSK